MTNMEWILENWCYSCDCAHEGTCEQHAIDKMFKNSEYFNKESNREKETLRVIDINDAFGYNEEETKDNLKEHIEKYEQAVTNNGEKDNMLKQKMIKDFERYDKFISDILEVSRNRGGSYHSHYIGLVGALNALQEDIQLNLEELKENH